MGAECVAPELGAVIYVVPWNPVNLQKFKKLIADYSIILPGYVINGVGWNAGKSIVVLLFHHL